MGLQEDIALCARPACTTADLNEQLRQAFRGAEIGAEQAFINADDHHQTESRQIVPLGQHLRADQDSGLVSKPCQVLFNSVTMLSGFTVDTHHRYVWEAFGQGQLQALRTRPLRNQCQSTTTWTGWRCGFAMTTVMADQLFTAMQGQRRITALTLAAPSTVMAQKYRRKAATIAEHQCLFAALQCLRRIRDEVPEMTIGVGTILTPEQVNDAKDNGATFGVAPGMNPRVVAEAARIGLPFAPGVCTPSDIELAIEAGCRVLKFFPCEPCGGLPYLRTIAAPFMHLGVQFIPLGGVNAANAPTYLKEPSVLALGGSWLAPKDLIAKGDWAAITALASEITGIVKQVRP